MNLEAQVRATIEQGLLRDAANLLDRETSLSLPLQVARVQLEAEIGSRREAHRHADALLGKHLGAREAIACLQVSGRALMRAGRAVEGISRYHKGLDLAREIGDSITEARLFAGLVEGLLHAVGVEPAALRMNALRRLALSVGDVQTLVTCHLLIGEIHTKRREFRRAETSMDAAAALLKSSPNMIQLGTHAMVRSAHAALQSDFAEAVSHARVALEYARRSGSTSLRMPALGNLIHSLTAAGRLDECRPILTEALACASPGSGAEIALINEEVELALAVGDLERAGTFAGQTLRLSSALGDGHSYYALCAALTRARWLIRLGKTRDATDLVSEFIPHIERAADGNLLESDEAARCRSPRTRRSAR